MRGDDVDKLAHAAAVTELNGTGDGGEQRIVLAQAHIFAGFIARAALPHNDRTAGDELTRKNLDASRCELESRPFFELPKPFLCAI